MCYNVYIYIYIIQLLILYPDGFIVGEILAFITISDHFIILGSLSLSPISWNTMQTMLFLIIPIATMSTYFISIARLLSLHLASREKIESSVFFH